MFSLKFPDLNEFTWKKQAQIYRKSQIIHSLIVIAKDSAIIEDTAKAIGCSHTSLVLNPNGEQILG